MEPVSSQLAPLTVLAGPTAVGKGTLVRRLRELYPDLPVSVSVTTRAPRPGEVHGEDYFFVSEEEFDRMVEEDALLEWAVVHGKHRYGTPAQWVEEQRKIGRPVLLEVDLEGARQVRRRRPDCQTVFVIPPSWEELERRLLRRGTEGPEERARRLATARGELAAADEFDVTIINDDVNRTAEELARLLELN